MPEIITFGCRLNTYESEVMRNHAQAAGLTDAVIINTCSVTGEAERQARQTIRRVRREKPSAKIIVTGCAAQVNPDLFAAMPEVDHVLGNDLKMKPESYVGLEAERVRISDMQKVKDVAAHLVHGYEGIWRGFVQVQNGCDHRCTFCIVPYGRGPSRSVPVEAIVEQVKELVAQGYHEIAFTGVDITSYGADLGSLPPWGEEVLLNKLGFEERSDESQARLAKPVGGQERDDGVMTPHQENLSLLCSASLTRSATSQTKIFYPPPKGGGGLTLGSMIRHVLDAVPNLPQVRLSSLDPVEVDEDLWALIAGEPRLMPHLHISMQAGDDMVLKRMKRRHLADDIRRFCERARALRPDVVFGADIIAGFPTETDEMFANTMWLVEECGLTWLHVFPYSARAGTPASKMPMVDMAVRRARAAQLRKLGEEAVARHLDSLVGQTLNVLVEQNGVGRSPTFAEVKLPFPVQVGSVITVDCVEREGMRVVGRLTVV